MRSRPSDLCLTAHRASRGIYGRPCRLALLGIAFGLIAAMPCRAETWAERLGFPPQSKVLLLHVNEMGMCYETNAAVIQGS